MDGMHDLGGKQGFGQVRYSPKAQTFHAPWEKRVNAMYGLAVKHGIINMDEYRHAIERMEPRHYLSASYYERSLTGLATLCVEKGVVTREELERLAQGAFPLSLPSAPGRGNAPERERFRPGDRVRVKDEFVPGHIRMPGYIRGKVGRDRGRDRRRTRFPTRTRTASRPWTSPPTTCAFGPRTCGPMAPTRPSCTPACSRAISSGFPDGTVRDALAGHNALERVQPVPVWLRVSLELLDEQLADLDRSLLNWSPSRPS